MLSIIRLQASDGRLFAMDRSAAEMSTLVQAFVSDLGAGSAPIPLPNVPGATLAKIVEYCTHHKDDVRLRKDVADLLRDDSMVEAWDRRFMDEDDATVLRILCAADYMGVEALVELCCLTIARAIRDPPVEAIRSRFGVKDNLSGAQCTQIVAEA
ncbi:suppressor of kinetochore protein mutant, partial [Coemansia biformis]